METIACLNCGSQDSELFLKGKNFYKEESDFYTLVKCHRCDLIYQNPRFSVDEMSKYYSDEEYYSYVELKNKKENKIGFLEKCRHYLLEKTLAYYYGGKRSPLSVFYAWIGRGRFGSLPKGIKPSRILDVGCGDGAFLHVVQQFGWDVHGVEISQDAAEHARKLGINVYCGDLISAPYSNDTFDVVRLWSVLEHLHNPIEVLEKIQKILKPGGLVTFQVPNIDSLASRVYGANWTGLHLPNHLIHFTPKTLKEVLEKAGYKVDKILFASVGTFWPSYKYQSHVKKSKFVLLIDPIMRITNIFFDRICDLFSKGDCLYVWVRKSN